MIDDGFVNLSNARTDGQKSVMKDIEERAECPFCPENLAKYHKKPILRKGQHWVLTENQWPYEHTQLHMLLIATSHLERLADVTEEAFGELLTFAQDIEKENKLESGAIGLRFGNTKRNGATVQHLHAHIIAADPNKPDDAKVRFRVG